MFLGHYAVAFAAKRFAPETSLGWFVAGALLADLLWPILLILGLEHVRIDPGNTAFTPLAFDSYPISHSLVTICGWALLFGFICWAMERGVRGAAIAGGLVVSHWILDAASHRADMPLYPGGGPLVGMGLWNSVPGTLVVEGLLFAAGLGLYMSVSRARDRTGRRGLWIFIVVLLLMYAGAAWGPPPPSASALAWVSLGAIVIPFWAAWLDRHRMETTAP